MMEDMTKKVFEEDSQVMLKRAKDLGLVIIGFITLSNWKKIALVSRTVRSLDGLGDENYEVALTEYNGRFVTIELFNRYDKAIEAFGKMVYEQQIELSR